MPMTRREFIKTTATATAATVAGIKLPAYATNVITDSAYTKLKWSKAPCRFCGVGCGIQVATKERRSTRA
jgi:nitrate reductase NapA